MANCALSHGAILHYIEGRIKGMKEANIPGPYRAILPVGADPDSPFDDEGPGAAVSDAHERGDDSTVNSLLLGMTLKDRILHITGVTEIEVSPDKNGVEVQTISATFAGVKLGEHSGPKPVEKK